MQLMRTFGAAIVLIAYSVWAQGEVIATPSIRYASQYDVVSDSGLTSAFVQMAKMVDPELNIVFRECGFINAFYSPSEKIITICYEYLYDAEQFVATNYGRQPIAVRSAM